MDGTEDGPQLVDVRVGSATDGKAPVSAVERSMVAGPIQWLSLLAVAFAAIAADQLTKALITQRFELGESSHVFGPFYIHHVKNPGIAFGFLQDAADVVTVLTFIAVIWMIWYFARSGARHPLLAIGLGFLIGGSIANLIDRLRIGEVTDFIDPERWPAFNLADVFITVGVAVLLVTLLASERNPRMRRVSSGG